MDYELPDAPMVHKCEYCDRVATLAAYMFNVRQQVAKYRYFCPTCYVEAYVYHAISGHEEVSIEKVRQ